uniref:Crossover junction endonuclease MUS81 n=2 Tax=Steinernema glaseri TaxID=37863 RepID=A0A1I7XZ79_9BILA
MASDDNDIIVLSDDEPSTSTAVVLQYNGPRNRTSNPARSHPPSSDPVVLVGEGTSFPKPISSGRSPVEIEILDVRPSTSLPLARSPTPLLEDEAYNYPAVQNNDDSWQASNGNDVPSCLDDAIILSDDDEPPVSSPVQMQRAETLVSSPLFGCHLTASTSAVRTSVVSPVPISRFTDDEIILSDEEPIARSEEVPKEADPRSSSPIEPIADCLVDLEGVEPMPDPEEPAPKKRRKRTREEIEQEKIAKEVARIQREANTAKNSKCEQYLHCYLSADIFNLEGSLEAKLLSLFQERQIVEQLHVEDELSQMHITWRRKEVNAVVENGKVTRKETMVKENVFAYVMDAHSLSELISSKTLPSYLDSILNQYPVPDARLTVIVYGKVSARNDKVTDCFLEAFEKRRIQFRLIESVDDFAYLIAQLHRALAKHDKSKDGESKAVFSAEKGMKPEDASSSDVFIRDWWGKMLLYMHRLSEEQRRAILRHHPNPFVLMDQLIAAPSPTAAMKGLADIVTEAGRRLGPVLAQKIYFMLTSVDGQHILTE